MSEVKTLSEAMLGMAYLHPSSKSPLATDADTAVAGFSRTGQNTANLPGKGLAGFLLTLDSDTRAKMQVFFCWYTGFGLYFRKRNSPATGACTWDTWHKVTLTAAT